MKSLAIATYWLYRVPDAATRSADLAWVWTVNSEKFRLRMRSWVTGSQYDAADCIAWMPTREVPEGVVRYVMSAEDASLMLFAYNACSATKASDAGCEQRIDLTTLLTWCPIGIIDDSQVAQILRWSLARMLVSEMLSSREIASVERIVRSVERHVKAAPGLHGPGLRGELAPGLGVLRRLLHGDP